MKKTDIIIARTEDAGGAFEVQGYQTSTPGLAAWNRPKLAYSWTDHSGNPHSKRINQTWALIHMPSGKHVAAARLQKEIEALAALLAPVCDWTEENISTDDLKVAAEILKENNGSL